MSCPWETALYGWRRQKTFGQSIAVPFLFRCLVGGVVRLLERVVVRLYRGSLPGFCCAWSLLPPPFSCCRHYGVVTGFGHGLSWEGRCRHLYEAAGHCFDSPRHCVLAVAGYLCSLCASARPTLFLAAASSLEVASPSFFHRGCWSRTVLRDQYQALLCIFFTWKPDTPSASAMWL